MFAKSVLWAKAHESGGVLHFIPRPKGRGNKLQQLPHLKLMLHSTSHGVTSYLVSHKQAPYHYHHQSSSDFDIPPLAWENLFISKS